MQINLTNQDAMELLRSIPDNSVQLVLTDPPYGITRLKWDNVPSLFGFLHEVKRVLKPRGVACIFACQKFTIQLCATDLEFFKYKWTWVKNAPCGMLNANRAPLRKHEDICVFYKNMPVYHPQMTPGTAYKRGASVKKQYVYGGFDRPERSYGNERFPTDVVQYNVIPNGTRLHSCQKPTDLLSMLIKTYTDPGDLVVDPFSGSGSTAVSCIETGRDFMGCELDPAIFETALTRINEVI